MYSRLVTIRSKSTLPVDLGECAKIKFELLDLIEEMLEKYFEDDEYVRYKTLIFDTFTTYGYVCFKQGMLMNEKETKDKA